MNLEVRANKQAKPAGPPAQPGSDELPEPGAGFVLQSAQTPEPGAVEKQLSSVASPAVSPEPRSLTSCSRAKARQAKRSSAEGQKVTSTGPRTRSPLVLEHHAAPAASPRRGKGAKGAGVAAPTAEKMKRRSRSRAKAQRSNGQSPGPEACGTCQPERSPTPPWSEESEDCKLDDHQSGLLTPNAVSDGEVTATHMQDAPLHDLFAGTCDGVGPSASVEAAHERSTPPKGLAEVLGPRLGGPRWNCQDKLVTRMREADDGGETSEEDLSFSVHSSSPSDRNKERPLFARPWQAPPRSRSAATAKVQLREQGVVNLVGPGYSFHREAAACQCHGDIDESTFGVAEVIRAAPALPAEKAPATPPAEALAATRACAAKSCGLAAVRSSGMPRRSASLGSRSACRPSAKGVGPGRAANAKTAQSGTRMHQRAMQGPSAIRHNAEGLEAPAHLATAGRPLEAETQDMRPQACSAISPKLFRVTTSVGIAIRAQPDVQANRTGGLLRYGEVFEVSAEVAGIDGRLYLKLHGADGWAFDDSAVDAEDPSVELLMNGWSCNSSSSANEDGVQGDAWGNRLPSGLMQMLSPRQAQIDDTALRPLAAARGVPQLGACPLLYIPPPCTKTAPAATLPPTQSRPPLAQGTADYCAGRARCVSASEHSLGRTESTLAVLSSTPPVQPGMKDVCRMESPPRVARQPSSCSQNAPPIMVPAPGVPSHAGSLMAPRVRPPLPRPHTALQSGNPVPKLEPCRHLVAAEPPRLSDAFRKVMTGGGSRAASPALRRSDWDTLLLVAN